MAKHPRKKITAESMAEFELALCDYLHLDLVEEQMHTLIAEIKANPDYESLYEEILEGSISDTAPREYLSDFVAHKLTGRGWPSNADTDETCVEFARAYIAGAKRFGYPCRMEQPPRDNRSLGHRVLMSLYGEGPRYLTQLERIFPADAGCDIQKALDGLIKAKMVKASNIPCGTIYSYVFA